MDSHPCGTFLVLREFKDIVGATGFDGSEESKWATAIANVSGPPEFWFGENIEYPTYEIGCGRSRRTEENYICIGKCVPGSQINLG